MVSHPSAIYREVPTLRFRTSVASWVGALLFTGLIPTAICAAPIYRDLGHQRVAGSWAQQPDNTYLIQPGFLTLDINQDARPDLSFEHGYRRPLHYLGQDDVDLLKTASAGISESLKLVQKIRPLVAEGIHVVSGEENSIAANESEIENAIETMERIAANWSYKGRRVLDGSMGVYAFSVDPNLAQVVRATDDTQPGHYAVEVTRAAERAKVLAPIAQEAAVSKDEIVSINGMNVQLIVGMTQDEVVDRINEYTSATGAWADIDGRYTRVGSETWGSRSEIDLVSNQRAAAESSGFGVTALHDYGVDVEVNVGGTVWSGRGRHVTVDHGLAKGLGLVVGEDFADPTSTVAAGSVVTVTVQDQSLHLSLLPLDAGPRIRVALPSIHPSGLGMGVRNNRIATLGDIWASTPEAAQDSLLVVDAAADELKATQQKLESLLERYYSPAGQAFVTLEDAAPGSSFALTSQPLSEGQLVSQDLSFSTDSLDIEQLMMNHAEGRSVLLGFRFVQDTETHYGWLRLSVDDDMRLTLQDLSYESASGEGIRIALVPEPTSLGLILPGLFLLARRRRA